MSMNAVNSGAPDPDSKRTAGAGGGGPPYDAGLDRRLVVLETRFDTILPTLATKTDLAELRVDFERLFSSLYTRMNDEINKMRDLQARLTDEMNKLRVEVHTTLMSMTKWCIALAVTVIFGVVGQGIYLGRQITDQSIHLGKQIADQSVQLNKQISDQGVQLNKQISDQGVQLSKQIADLAARLPPARPPSAQAPDRAPPAQVASVSAPRAGATMAPR